MFGDYEDMASKSLCVSLVEEFLLNLKLNQGVILWIGFALRSVKCLHREKVVNFWEIQIDTIQEYSSLMVRSLSILS